MTALSITAASVKLITGPTIEIVAGEAFIAGTLLYQKSTDFLWYKAQSDGSADEAGAVKIAMALFTADVIGARGSGATSEAIVQTGAGVAGVGYYISPTAGSITATLADIVSPGRVTFAALGIGGSPAQLLIQRIYNAGSVVP